MEKLGHEYLPNPNQQVVPTNAGDALIDLIRYQVSINRWTREKTKELVRDIDPGKIVRAIQGKMEGEEPLKPFESELATAVDWCIQKGFLRKNTDIVTTIAFAQFKIEHNQAFIAYTERLQETSS